MKKKKKTKKKKNLRKVSSLDLFYLALLAFVFIASSALALSRRNEKPLLIREEIEPSSFAPIPTLTGTAAFPVLSAQAALAYDLDSGITLYEKNADSPLLPASTTKIVTAIVAMEHFSAEDIVRVEKVTVPGQKMGLVAGEEIRVEDLLYGLLIFSANDAAEVLARNYPGGREAFIVVMNLKAKELGLENTLFENPTGLDGGGHASTARDLVRVADVAMRMPEFAEMVGTKERYVTSIDKSVAHRLVNLNELVGEVEGVLGVKTGWTENARENLVTYVERNDRKIMLALLGSQDRFGETEELIEWIFENYEWEEIEYPF